MLKEKISLEVIAKSQIGFAEQFLCGEVSEEVYRVFCLAMGSAATGIEACDLASGMTYRGSSQVAEEIDNIDLTGDKDGINSC